ncbi:WD_REPEATS_REGION domain-containing protein [Mortierella sp. 14UC]|nr:WD_REPEATS_REGION domain-containing protein [Mortierella sp. 14UC]
MSSSAAQVESSQSNSLVPSSLEASEVTIDGKRTVAQLERTVKIGRLTSSSANITDAVRRVQNVADETELALQSLKIRRLRDYKQAVYIPPMAKPSLQAMNETLFSLMDQVDEFLTGDGQVMLILGDSGAGKSTFIQHLEHLLWQNYRAGGSIPLLINLPTLDRPDKELVTEQLKTYSFSEEQILELKQHRQFVLICDGHDESQITDNLHDTNLLNQSKQWSAKLFVTCRTQYLGPDYRERFFPKSTSQYQHSVVDLFQEAVLAPFSKEQIETYIDLYVPLEPRTWVKKDYMDKLATIPNLLDLVKNPFLLTLCLETLPSVVQGKSDLSRLCLTRAQLYDNFVVQWLRANRRRLQNQKLMGDTLRVLQDLDEAGFEQSGVDFQTELASAIFREQEGKPVVDYIHEHDKKTWKAAFFCPDPEPTLLRDASLLSRAGTHYMFVHRSVLEYFYSCTICPSAANSGEFAPHAYFDFAAMLMSITTHPLSRRNLVAEPSIVHFLSERVLSNPDFKRHLLAIIELSKNDQQASGAAANAITILVRAGVHFNGADLRGIRIPRADASGGQFDSAQFQDSDLSGVNFTKSWIRQANFSNAQMERVLFGELPFLQEDKGVTTCAYSPDGKLFALSRSDGATNIYDTSSWTKIHSLSWYGATAVCIAFSPSNPQVLIRDHGKAIWLWNYETGALHLGLGMVLDPVSAAAFSPCGRHIISIEGDNTANLRYARTGTLDRTLTDKMSSPTWVALSPDGQRIATGSMDGTVEIFDAQNGLSVVSWKVKHESITCAMYSRDGWWILTGNEGGDLQLLEATTGRAGPTWKAHPTGIKAVDFSSNGRWIASCADELVSKPWNELAWRPQTELVVRLWDARTGTAISAFAGHVKAVSSVAFSPDGLQLASCSLDGTVRLWDVSSIETGPNSQGTSDPISNVVYSPDGRRLVSGSHNGTLQQHDADSGELGLVVTAGYDWRDCVAFSSDGLRYVAADRMGTVTIHDAETGAVVVVFSVYCTFFTIAMALSHRWVATCSSDGPVRLWDAVSGEPGRVFSGQTEMSRSLAFSPNGQQIAITSYDGTIRIWAVDSGEFKVLEGGKHEHTKAVAYVSDSLVLATSSVDSGEKWLIRFWDANTGRELGPGPRSANPISCMAFSPCKQWIATACTRSVCLWRYESSSALSPATWRDTLIIDGFFGDVDSITWRTGSDTLEFATGCKDGSIRAWRLREASGYWSVNLIWSAGSIALAAQDAVIEEFPDRNMDPLISSFLKLSRKARRSYIKNVTKDEKELVAKIFRKYPYTDDFDCIEVALYEYDDPVAMIRLHYWIVTPMVPKIPQPDMYATVNGLILSLSRKDNRYKAEIIKYLEEKGLMNDSFL